MIEYLQTLVGHADLVEIGEDQRTVELSFGPGSGDGIVFMPEITPGFADKRHIQTILGPAAPERHNPL